MPAYLIANITVLDPEQFARYVAQAPGVVASFGGRYLVRAGAYDVLEGDPQVNRTSVIEFPDMRSVRAFYDSPEYQALVPLRSGATVSHLFAIEGYAPVA